MVISKQECNAQQDRPNVILIMADDMGWGDTGYNGHPRIKTPHLDDMANNGLRFSRFYSGGPVCSPTRGSCLTGRNPNRYGIFSANVGHLKKEEITLAGVFKTKDYATGHFGKWHLGTLFPDFSGKGPKRDPKANYLTPGMSGFDEWFSTEFAVATYDPYKLDKLHEFRGDRRRCYVENGEVLKEDLTGCDSKIIMDRALPFINKCVAEKKPFFTVIWFHAPHAPIVGHPKYMKELYADCSEDQQHYYSVITALDVQVGRLRQELKELGIDDNTIVCFTSDNGPEGNPGRRGRYQGSAGELRGRKRSLYEGGIRVPGIIEWPEKIKEARVCDMPAVTSDYFSTFCDLLGYKVKDNRPYDGESLLPLIEKGKSKRKHNIGFWFTGHNQEALSGNRYKLIHNIGDTRARSDNSKNLRQEFELYDLINDPGETKNIIADHPKVGKAMKKELEVFINSCKNSEQGADY
ncbi:N-acetylgalactosamine 6-sulfate sulfatase [Puteibacter caeruleilacunae]|nr:N-acetylgalactosamine 6-sulfate sulfatase [Puteibacter caeruleilacunae]